MTPRTILCIRHGQSTANVAWENDAEDPLQIDARLTAKGEAQVRAARERLRHEPVELVITSPLTRALQTSTGIFADHPNRPPILVEPLHREFQENSGDVGRPASLLAREFPHLSLSHLPEVWWHAEGEPDHRGIHVEPPHRLQDRLARFRALLASRPERTIAVVGHATFFWHLTGEMLENCGVARLQLDAGSAARAG
ncbi:histidine phosphatase family protein [Lichenicoccus roseus]|uniref:Histidine phosphatase family protein n=1 Tax=Lichenicoccus roseus TaxID=2683649 RepID=A0A5R9JJ28_9PROT|nr:histidine phosphatase family protein [Lichenicoccus roseus]TLU74338.1 histidine phosphatase family protein [Lichenicoccus roseus]